MSSEVIQSYQLSADQQLRFDALTRPPPISWPTVWLTLICATLIWGSDVLGISGVLPLWACALINAAGGYFMFSAVHDAIHRSVSSNIKLNDWVGRLALLPLSPMTSLGLFRWGHIQHHRHTVSALDPDRWAYEGPKWLLPFRWMLIDAWYLYFVIASKDRVAYKHLKNTLVLVAIGLSTIVLLIWAGYSMEVFMLWFVPSRIANMTLGFTFFWLPHEPHDVSQEENFTRASTIRLGHEWLLSPLLQYQNFHLIHHLHTRTPFYNNGKVWKLLESNLRKHELAIQDGLAIRPRLHIPENLTA